VGQRPGFANTSEPRKNVVGAIAKNAGAAAGRALTASLRAATSAGAVRFLEHRCRICAHSRVAWTTKIHRLVRRAPHGLLPATTSLQ
jgi:hypothetical protein